MTRGSQRKNIAIVNQRGALSLSTTIEKNSPKEKYINNPNKRLIFHHLG